MDWLKTKNSKEAGIDDWVTVYEKPKFDPSQPFEIVESKAKEHKVHTREEKIAFIKNKLKKRALTPEEELELLEAEEKVYQEQKNKSFDPDKYLASKSLDAKTRIFDAFTALFFCLGLMAFFWGLRRWILWVFVKN